MMPSPITDPNHRLSNDSAVVARASADHGGGQHVDVDEVVVGAVLVAVGDGVDEGLHQQRRHRPDGCARHEGDADRPPAGPMR